MSANGEPEDRWSSSKEWIKDVLSKSGTDLMEIQKPKGMDFHSLKFTIDFN